MKTFAASILAAIVIVLGGCRGAQEVVDSSERTVAVGQSNEQDLTHYVGSYGSRKISLVDGTLMYRDERMPSAVVLEAAGVDTFEVVVPPGAQVRGPGPDHVVPAFVFGRDESNKVVSLSFVTPDGTIVATVERDQ